MLADGNGDFTRAVGLEMDASKFGMGKRSQRYSMIVDNGVVKVAQCGGAGRVRSFQRRPYAGSALSAAHLQTENGGAGDGASARSR